jgi:hypothetical protein
MGIDGASSIRVRQALLPQQGAAWAWAELHGLAGSSLIQILAMIMQLVHGYMQFFLS